MSDLSSTVGTRVRTEGGGTVTTSESVVVLPPAVGGLLAAVRRTVAQMREQAPGTGAGSWPREEREAAIGELDCLVQELTLYRGEVLREHEKSGQWGSLSDRDFADYRARTTGTGRGAAIGERQLAQGLEELPALAEAVQEGKLNLEHAKTLTRLHEKGSPEVKDALTGGGLDALVEEAAEGKLSAPELGRKARAWAALVDAEAAQRDFQAVRRRRSFTMRTQGGGVAGEFFLDPVAGEQVRAALEAIAGRPAVEDDRTREQRMADAFTTMAGRTLQVGSDLVGAQVRPHVALLVAEETWVGIQARRRRFASCPDGPPPPWPNAPAGQLEDGTPIPLGELERLMCDCETTRIVLDANGVPLDVGQTQRTYTKELRRAVVTRDRHCQWPQCRLRASWCEVHHLVYYSRGGPTSLANAITLCTYHHHRVHQHDIRITTLPDGFDFHHRSGTHIGTTRRDEPLTGLLPCPTATGTGAGAGAGAGSMQGGPTPEKAQHAASSPTVAGAQQSSRTATPPSPGAEGTAMPGDRSGSAPPGRAEGTDAPTGD